MEQNKKKTLLVILLIVALVTIDQLVKICVKTHMTLDEEIRVFGHWFYIHFIENRGAAYGMELGGSYGKLLLSLFRIAAVGVIGWYIHRLIKRGAPTGVILGAVRLVEAAGKRKIAVFNHFFFRFLPAGWGACALYSARTIAPRGTLIAPFER